MKEKNDNNKSHENSQNAGTKIPKSGVGIDNMEIIFGIIGAVAGIFGMIVSVTSFFRNRLDTAISYLEYDRDTEYIKARRAIYQTPKECITPEYDDEDGNLAKVILVYNTSGLFVRKRRLPLWVFYKTSAMQTCIVFYEKLEPYIRSRQAENMFYGKEFEWLYNKIIRKQKRREYIKNLWQRSGSKKSNSP